jgi:hypothetical protein
MGMKYQVRLFQKDDTSKVVIFGDPQRPVGQLGSLPNLSEFEVEINKKP